MKRDLNLPGFIDGKGVNKVNLGSTYSLEKAAAPHIGCWTAAPVLPRRKLPSA